VKTFVIGAVAALAVTASDVAPAFAQKSGGVLRVYHRDNAPSGSILEEATNSVIEPFMGVYNNLVVFDQTKPVNSNETIVPDLATSWSWDATNTKLTFKLREGVKWHDGKPFSSADVKCTFELLLGTARDKLRKNPRKVWFENVSGVTSNGPNEVTVELKAPQPGLLQLLAAGYTPMYPCHVNAQQMRTEPVGTGPFKFAEWKRNESMRFVKNADYFKKGKPYLDGIEWRIIPNRSTRILAFAAGEFDYTFSADITVPLVKDVKAKAPDAVCEIRPTNVSTNLIVNRDKPPFDNPKVRQAMDMALDRDAFITILSEGRNNKGGALLPAPEGQWGLTIEELSQLPGYGTGEAVRKAQGEAKKIMESLGYSAEKPLQVKVSTRDIAIYRDPAVILIDQLKAIHIAGELEVVDTSIWHAKVARKDYAVGLNLTGIGVDDPDAGLIENYTCASERNYTKYCNPEVDKAIFAQSRELDVAKRKAMVKDIQKRLIADVARPIIFYGRNYSCWQPHVKGIVLHQNSIYNGARYEDIWLDR